jgi:HSP20 family molecular chaperone IbpA
MLRRDIDSIFNSDIFNWVSAPYIYYDRPSVSKSLNYVEETTDETHTIKVDVPGIKAKDLEVLQEEAVLRIKGLRGQKKFEYVYRVPTGFDPGTVKGSLEDGVLTLSVEKIPTKKPRKIELLLNS